MLPTIALGGVEVRAWALCVTVGVLLCWGLVLGRARGLGLDGASVFVWMLLGFPVGAVGAFALAWLVERVAGAFVPLAASPTGMTVLGSVIACGLYFVVDARRRFGRRGWELLDAAAFAPPLALAFGRLGCLLAGCCFGAPAPPSLPRALAIAVARYRDGTPAAAYYEGAARDLGLWNFPVVMALAALAVVLLVETAYAARARLGLRPGVVFTGGILVEELVRLPLEATRAELHLGDSALNLWQPAVLLVVVAAGAATLVLQRSSASAARASAR